ncbi:formyl transferase [Pelobium manganitolerans]|uniref:phosphoribosylglycinamide formyltransferase 1 n=1 Tax=Pelobium manganitolerans TaxID=1842495 RepID=A0A419S1P8_9SPHI|nr:formyltransferase family protein [Pelobium manganitolerans]RKD12403.1 formyl transferase [Pelobium manganitolerans]
MVTKQKVILCGFNWTGCKALRLLLENNYEVFVYTSPSPNYVNNLAVYCEENNVAYSFEKISLENIPFKPLFIASIYYRYIIAEPIIAYASGKIFNLHPSLLPDYRGCSSLTWAMINGEKRCGFTFHYINKGVDTGNIILQKEMLIEDFDTQVTLYNRVMFESMKYFNEVVKQVLAGDPGYAQPDADESKYFKRGCPHQGIIADDWNIAKKKRFVRAMLYPPLPEARYNNGEIAKLTDFFQV